MEIKKNKRADLEEGRITRLLMALVFILSSILVALEYNTGGEDNDNIDDELLDEVTREVEMMPVTQQEDRIALAPKKKQEATPLKINVVDKEIAPPEEELDKADGDNKGEDSELESTKNTDEADYATAQTDLGDNPLNFHIVEDLPKFPGGAVELMKWLTKNLRYPSDAQRNKKEGKVVVQFIVNKDGTMSNLKVVKSAQYASLDREALRVMRKMPKWTPGVQNDKPCRTMVCIPVVFKL
ncbi:MAG: energy transducer TonB [Prevotella sp.]|nr:energy transducer TonB [Prevotella sp.]